MFQVCFFTDFLSELFAFFADNVKNNIKMGKGLGYVRLTVPGRNELSNLPTVLQIGGKTVEDIIEGINSEVATKASTSAVAAKCDLSVIAPAYDATDTYAEGAVVTHDGKLYECSSAIETAEEFNADHWTQTTVVELIAALASGD